MEIKKAMVQQSVLHGVVGGRSTV